MNKWNFILSFLGKLYTVTVDVSDNKINDLICQINQHHNKHTRTKLHYHDLTRINTINTVAFSIVRDIPRFELILIIEGFMNILSEYAVNQNEVEELKVVHDYFSKRETNENEMLFVSRDYVAPTFKIVSDGVCYYTPQKIILKHSDTFSYFMRYLKDHYRVHDHRSRDLLLIECPSHDKDELISLLVKFGYVKCTIKEDVGGYGFRYNSYDHFNRFNPFAR